MQLRMWYPSKYCIRMPSFENLFQFLDVNNSSILVKWHQNLVHKIKMSLHMSCDRYAIQIKYKHSKLHILNRGQYHKVNILSQLMSLLNGLEHTYDKAMFCTESNTQVTITTVIIRVHEIIELCRFKSQIRVCQSKRYSTLLTKFEHETNTLAHSKCRYYIISVRLSQSFYFIFRQIKMIQ